jgi:hypothetical protein
MKKIFYNTHVLVGLHVALLVSISFMLINADYQIRFYQALVDRTVTPGMNDQEKVLALMNTSHMLVTKSNEVFGGSIKPGLKEKLFGSSQEVLTGGGSCGGFVHVMGRALRTAGYTIRVAQMKIGGIDGSHIILEVLIDGKYRVVDPFFDVAYINKNGELATFQEISSNWEYFSAQVPPDYPAIYNYEDVRYINWGKIPVVLPLIKNMLVVFWGEDTVDHISLRAHLLEAYRDRALLLGILYMGVLILTVLSARDRRLKRKS